MTDELKLYALAMGAESATNWSFFAGYVKAHSLEEAIGHGHGRAEEVYRKEAGWTNHGVSVCEIKAEVLA